MQQRMFVQVFKDSRTLSAFTQGRLGATMDIPLIIASVTSSTHSQPSLATKTLTSLPVQLSTLKFPLPPSINYILKKTTPTSPQNSSHLSKAHVIYR